MTRTRIVLACLAALFALAGISASSAFGSATPTWYECVKASPKNSGDYANKTCSEPSEAGKGGYVLKEGIGKGKEFKGKASGTAEAPAAILHVKTWLGDNKVACESAKSNGKLELPNLERDVTVSYSKCKALGTKTCTSAGAKKGEIKIAGLKGELGYLDETGPVVGLKLESEAHPGPTGLLTTFTCKDFEATVTGGVIGTVQKDVNVISKESETVDSPGEIIGEHEYDGNKYKPLVNPLGWADEATEIATELEADLKGELTKLERPIIKTLICGEFIESLLKVSCTPETYAGLQGTVTNKGEALEIKA